MNIILNGEKLQLCVFIAVFVLCTIYVIPGKNFFFKYDVKHFYKYKYIINVIYDLAGIILIPLGLNVLNNKAIDDISICLFGISIIVFIIVAYIRYFIEKTYDELKNEFSYENKAFLLYSSKPTAQIIIQIYLTNLAYLPANFVYNYFLKKHDINLEVIVILYCIWVLIAVKLSFTNIVKIFINMYIIKLRNSEWKKIIAYFLTIIINTIYALSLNIKINSFLFWSLNIILATGIIFFVQLTSSVRFSMYATGNYTKIQNDVYIVDKNVKLKISIVLNKSEPGKFKLLGILSYKKLLILRLDSRRSEYFNKVDSGECFERSNEVKNTYEFSLYVKDIFSKLKNNKVQYAVFLNENGDLLYQPLIKMEEEE